MVYFVQMKSSISNFLCYASYSFNFLQIHGCICFRITKSAFLSHRPRIEKMGNLHTCDAKFSDIKGLEGGGGGGADFSLFRDVETCQSLSVIISDDGKDCWSVQAVKCIEHIQHSVTSSEISSIKTPLTDGDEFQHHGIMGRGWIQQIQICGFPICYIYINKVPE